ncbi:MAG: bifunctional DNA-formamidopyrimidine glycosylase/DNA-(apurinic or apyrimidinic site) lyase [Pseudomonadales bacterium]
MPELPEVETTCRGIAPHCVGQQVVDIIVRQPKLRWPVPADLQTHMQGRTITKVFRRAKYLLLSLEDSGHLMLHLGMSGSLRIVSANEPSGAHDHLDVVFSNGQALRLRDPRRFGAALWVTGDPAEHSLLSALGPEPLSQDLDGDYLYQRSRGRKGAIKTFIMDGHIVVGVGNIYANEALFAAGIRPDRAAGRVSLARYRVLSDAIKRILAAAIEKGGTTLRDFVDGEGKPGYFQQELQVYGREGQPCCVCDRSLSLSRLGQRATVFCRHCQR